MRLDLGRDLCCQSWLRKERKDVDSYLDCVKALQVVRIAEGGYRTQVRVVGRWRTVRVFSDIIASRISYQSLPRRRPS